MSYRKNPMMEALDADIAAARAAPMLAKAAALENLILALRNVLAIYDRRLSDLEARAYPRRTP